MAKERIERTNRHAKQLALTNGFYVILSFVLFAIWLFQCDDYNISDDRGSLIYGQISDSTTNLPLEGWVGSDSVFDTTSGVFYFADSTGRYRFPTMSSSGRIFGGMEGYQTQMKEYQVAFGESTIINFRLAPEQGKIYIFGRYLG